MDSVASASCRSTSSSDRRAERRDQAMGAAAVASPMTMRPGGPASRRPRAAPSPPDPTDTATDRIRDQRGARGPGSLGQGIGGARSPIAGGPAGRRPGVGSPCRPALGPDRGTGRRGHDRPPGRRPARVRRPATASRRAVHPTPRGASLDHAPQPAQCARPRGCPVRVRRRTQRQRTRRAGRAGDGARRRDHRGHRGTVWPGLRSRPEHARVDALVALGQHPQEGRGRPRGAQALGSFTAPREDVVHGDRAAPHALHRRRSGSPPSARRGAGSCAPPGRARRRSAPGRA